MMMVNRSLNNTEAVQDGKERERMMNEVQAMLREMRFKSCTGQTKVADKEKTAAEKRECAQTGSKGQFKGRY